MTAIVATKTAHDLVSAALRSNTRLTIPGFVVSALPSTADIDSLYADGYEGRILSCEIVSSNTAKFCIYLPENMPREGTLEVASVYLLTLDRRVFAHGTLDMPIAKSIDMPLRLDAFVTVPHLGSVLNALVGPIDSVPVARLPQAHTVMLSSVDTDRQQVLSQKYAGRLSFDNFKRVYSGNVEYVGPAQFAFNVFERGGFWLNDKERVIVQVVSGESQGTATQAWFYSKDRFVLDDGILTPGCSVAIWRSDVREIPDRRHPTYMVLGIGKNDYKRSVTAFPTGAFQCVVKEGSLTPGASEIRLTGISDTSIAHKSHHCVFVDGKPLPLKEWSLLPDSSIRVEKANVVRRYSVESFNFIESLSATTMCFDVSYVVGDEFTDADSPYFHLPIIPQSEDSIWLFINDEKQARSSYSFQGTSVIPDVAVEKGDKIDIVLFANKERANTVSKAEVFEHTFDATSGFIALPTQPERNGVLLLTDVGYINSANYTIEDGGLRVKPGVLLNHALCQVVVFSSETVIVGSQEYAYTGINTGPVWVDPAGKMTEPCRVRIHHLTDRGDGSKSIWTTPPVRDADHLIVFAANRLLDTHQYVYSTKTSAIVLNDPLPENELIDIWAVETITDPYGMGDELLFFQTQSTTGASLWYDLPNGCNLDNTFVFIDGKYCHKDTLLWNGTGFQPRVAPIGSLPIYCLSVTTREKEGFTTRVVREEQDMTTLDTYSTVHPYKSESTMLFKTLVHQLPSTYTISGEFENQFKLEPVPDAVLHIIGFQNSIPLSRLILREDLDSARSWIISEFRKLMPLYGPYVKWSNLTDQVKERLACPLLKLNQILNGDVEDLISGKPFDDDVKDLANSLGIKPVEMNLSMDVLLTAAYGTVGSGAMLGVPVDFNVYKYLEVYLKDLLGSDSFSIKKYEVGKKYFIDEIDVSKLQYTAVSRPEIPPIHQSSSFYLSPGVGSSTYPGLMIMGTAHDCAYSKANSTLPAGFSVGANSLRTVSVVMVDDDKANTFTWIHEIQDDYSGKDYTVSWQRPQYVDPKNYNTDYLTLVDGADAPGYVRMFARAHASFQYNDADCRRVLWYMKHGEYGEKWAPDGSLYVSHSNGSYLANVSYTANIAFSAAITEFNKDTGDAKLSINMNSNVGYIRFPANQFMKSMTLPVKFKVFPGINVNPDGSIDVVISNEDLFKSCCWDVQPSTSLDCSAPEVHE